MVFGLQRLGFLFLLAFPLGCLRLDDVLSDAQALRLFRRFVEQGSEVLCAAGALDPNATVSVVAMQAGKEGFGGWFGVGWCGFCGEVEHLFVFLVWFFVGEVKHFFVFLVVFSVFVAFLVVLLWKR